MGAVRNDRICGICLCGECAVRRATHLSRREVRPRPLKSLAAVRRFRRGRGRCRALSAPCASRVGGVLHQGACGRGDLPCGKHGRRQKMCGDDVRVLCPHLCPRRCADGDLFLFRHSNCRRDGVLRRTRARCAHFCGRGHLFLRDDRAFPRAIPLPPRAALHGGLHAVRRRQNGALEGADRQRKLPYIPRRARVRTLRRRGVRALRRIAACLRADGGGHGERQTGAPRAAHRHIARGGILRRRLCDGGRSACALSGDLASRSDGRRGR